MEFRYSAITLKKREVGETDRLYVLYTREAGKVQVKAAGVRKSEAKLAGQLETLSYGSVMVVRGRGSGKIAGALSENTFYFLRQELEVLQRVVQVVNSMERLVDWEEKDPVLFDLLLQYLSLGDELVREEKKEKFFLLSEAFLIQLYAHLGYRIETNVCSVSGEKLESGGKHFFSPSAGGVIAERQSASGNRAFPMSENAIKLIRLILGNKLESIPRIDAEEKVLREVRQASNHFFRWILH